jgi:hypothetical protein
VHLSVIVLNTQNKHEGTTGLLINMVTADLAVPAEAWQCFCEFASLATFWPVAFEEALYETLINRGLKWQVATHKRRQQAAPTMLVLMLSGLSAYQVVPSCGGLQSASNVACSCSSITPCCPLTAAEGPAISGGYVVDCFSQSRCARICYVARQHHSCDTHYVMFRMFLKLSPEAG